MTCARCGQALRATSRFCPSCGEPVRAARGARADESAPTTATSPFSRTATTGADEAGQGQTVEPADPSSGGTTDAVLSEPSTSWQTAQQLLREHGRGVATGVTGAVLVGIYATLQVLPALVAAVNDNQPSKVAFVLLALPLVAVALAGTLLLVQRAQDVRAEGGAVEPVHALAAAAGVLVSTYGILVVIAALISKGAGALTLL
jgi:hypothetical protein